MTIITNNYQKREHVSTFSTNFSTSSNNRKHNIYLATSKFCWIYILPGEELSFNNIVGERIEQNGYKKALVINYGEYVEGIGGGVCQVSSTLYGAWIRADLKVKEVRAHSLPASYVEMSQDATVSTFQDLILLNDSQSAVVVNGYVKNENIVFDVYAKKLEYEIKIRTNIKEIIPPPSPIVQHIKDLCEYKMNENGQVILKNERPGYVTQAIMEYYKDDKLICQKIIRNDIYKAVQGTIGVYEQEEGLQDLEFTD